MRADRASRDEVHAGRAAGYPAAATEPPRCRMCGGAGTLLYPDCLDLEYFTTSDAAMYRCVACTLVFLHPLPTREELAALYPANYYNFQARRGALARFLFERYHTRQAFLCMRHLGPEGAFLEVGCGDGGILAKLRERGIADVQGIEIASAGVEAARRKGLRVFHGTLEEFDTHDRFDMVFLSHVIEHVLDPGFAMRRVAELLKPGGVVYVETPNVGSLDGRLWASNWGLIHYPRHLYLFDPGTLRRLLEGAGLRVERSTFELNSCGWALSIQHWLRKHGFDRARQPRSFYYNALLMLCLPLNLLDLLAGGTAFMGVIARKVT
ncbi:MAG: class I SAM-dependent methyltransferase [Thermodesulfobacteriota bacterium]